MFFELEDIERRHSVYWDVYNANSWVTPPDSSLKWNYKRGAFVGVAAALLQENFINFQENWRLLLRNYEPPATLKQLGIFTKSVFQMDNFKKALKNRNQYGLSIGLTDIASRVACFRWVNGGWQRQWGGFEYNLFRKIPGALFTAAFTAPISVPFEMARMAYYADKTFPKELQRNYKSFFNALRRIPFEEGPFFLFKNSTPFMLRNFFQTFTMFYTYDFLKDKLSFIWRVGQVPYEPVKWFNVLFSTYLACAFSYPWNNVVREMIEFWPKQNGQDLFKGNYRKAATWLYYHEWGSNLFPGFFNNYFWRQAPWMMSTLYLADSMGVFYQQVSNQYTNAGTNAWEDSIL